MKIIHTSDIHLNSKMESRLPKEKAKERKSELLLTFTNLVSYAKQNNVDAIIIAGDLFDTDSINKTLFEYVLNLIVSSPNITFYYLCGNHEKSSFLNLITEMPSNLKCFGDTWTSYNLDNNVVVSGINITKENHKSLYSSLKLDSKKFNIVTMHGQISKYFSDDNYEIVNLNELKNKNINYLALGHIHSYMLEKFDNDYYYAYSGCLEGRGFDECGTKGFIELDITDKISTKFVPFAKREVCEIEVDISNISQLNDIISHINKCVDNIDKSSLVKIKLIGDVTDDTNLDLSFIETAFSNKFYFSVIENNTRLKVDIEKYRYNQSINGEFIRLVLNSDLSDHEKEQIIMLGLKALNGEVNVWK